MPAPSAPAAAARYQGGRGQGLTAGAGLGGLVYYSAGVAGMGSFGAASALPDNGPLWLAAGSPRG